jgi:hypothetical protein
LAAGRRFTVIVVLCIFAFLLTPVGGALATFGSRARRGESLAFGIRGVCPHFASHHPPATPPYGGGGLHDVQTKKIRKGNKFKKYFRVPCAPSLALSAAAWFPGAGRQCYLLQVSSTIIVSCFLGPLCPRVPAAVGHRIPCVSSAPSGLFSFLTYIFIYI